MPPARYHHEAAAELESAALWYERQVPGLGNEFLDEVDRTVDLIGGSPSLWPLWPDVTDSSQIRRALLSRFPYAIAYVDLGEEVVIIAVAHSSRRPGYWRSRLDPGR